MYLLNIILFKKLYIKTNLYHKTKMCWEFHNDLIFGKFYSSLLLLLVISV